MADKGMNGSDEGRARYVWDREKLSWVESDQGSQPGEMAAESAIEAPADAVAEKARPVIVSAEGEELQLRGAWIRFVGLALDMVLIVLLQSILQVIFGTDSTVSRFLIPLLGLAYFVCFWTLRGQTPGKMAIGARIVRLDGSPPGFARSLLRYVVFLVYFFALGQSAGVSVWIAIVIAAVIFAIVSLSRSKRGLHDLAAGTIVINSRPKLMEDYDEEVWEAPDAEIDALEPEEE